MNEIIDFILARLAEVKPCDGSGGEYRTCDDLTQAAEGLAEVVTEQVGLIRASTDRPVPFTLKLARIWNDHPDFDPAWAS